MGYSASMKFVYFNAKKGDPIMNEETVVTETNTPAAPAVNKAPRTKKPAAAAAKAPKGKGKHADAVKKAKGEKKERSDADRSASVAKSWGNAKVAKARSARHHVKVAGTEYNSVFAALEALKLPTKYCIPFRKKLKASGKETLEHEGKKYNFILVEPTKE